MRPRNSKSIPQKILLGAGKFVPFRQIIDTFNAQSRLKKGVTKESILSAMSNLADQGFGVLHNEVFYKNPNLTNRKLVEHGITYQEYHDQLESIRPLGCVTRSKAEQCMELYNSFADRQAS